MSPKQKKRAAELLREYADYLMRYNIRPAERAAEPPFTLSDEQYDHFHQTMTNPESPTPAMMKAADDIREYAKRNAAAEPEKPDNDDAWADAEIDAMKPVETEHWARRVIEPVVFNRMIERLRASPSAQPIAREPTKEMIEAARRVEPWLTSLLCRKLWYAMHDAVLKSAGKEST